MHHYTLCLIKRKEELLLLNRRKKPAMGMWNGVGGKVEKGESPLNCVIRETSEETGIHLDDPLYVGNAVFKTGNKVEKLYLFMAELPEDTIVHTPMYTEEGILDWKPVSWVLDKDNMGIINNLKCYLPKLLNGEFGLEHSFIYEDQRITEYRIDRITEGEVHRKQLTKS
ncbi:NUDIX hydrolase [Halobacillus mangrovi]|uniref:NUDIX hydrolase n=1 Tax=Halobacillus mangrovi TaxID=402384 RepID=UPI003D976160